MVECVLQNHFCDLDSYLFNSNHNGRDGGSNPPPAIKCQNNSVGRVVPSYGKSHRFDSYFWHYMVVIVQLARTSDCGSENREFKSH